MITYEAALTQAFAGNTPAQLSIEHVGGEAMLRYTYPEKDKSNKSGVGLDFPIGRSPDKDRVGQIREVWGLIAKQLKFEGKLPQEHEGV